MTTAKERLLTLVEGSELAPDGALMNQILTSAVDAFVTHTSAELERVKGYGNGQGEAPAYTPTVDEPTGEDDSEAEWTVTEVSEEPEAEEKTETPPAAAKPTRLGDRAEELAEKICDVISSTPDGYAAKGKMYQELGPQGFTRNHVNAVCKKLVADGKIFMRGSKRMATYGFVKSPA